MNNVYIRMNNRKYKTKFERIIDRFYGIRIEKIKNGIIIVLPEKYNKTKSKQKINKIIKNEINPYVLYSDELQCLQSENRNFEGKKLMRFLIIQIIEKLFATGRANSFIEDIYVFVNEYSKDNLKIIDDLTGRFKTVNIITPKISKFKILERMYERKNVIITVSNNKRKSTRKARYIINFDFDIEMFNKYVIPNDSLIINTYDEILVPNMNFKGIIINNYNIIIDKDINVFLNEYYGNFELKLLIESFLIQSNYEQAKNYLKKYNIEISEVIGIRGVIDKKEIEIHYKNSKQNY